MLRPAAGVLPGTAPSHGICGCSGLDVHLGARPAASPITLTVYQHRKTTAVAFFSIASESQNARLMCAAHR